MNAKIREDWDGSVIHVGRSVRVTAGLVAGLKVGRDAIAEGRRKQSFPRKAQGTIGCPNDYPLYY